MKKAEVNEDFSLIYLFNKLLAVADIYAFPQLACGCFPAHQLTAYGVDRAGFSTTVSSIYNTQTLI